MRDSGSRQFSGGTNIHDVVREGCDGPTARPLAHAGAVLRLPRVRRLLPARGDRTRPAPHPRVPVQLLRLACGLAGVARALHADRPGHARHGLLGQARRVRVRRARSRRHARGASCSPRRLGVPCAGARPRRQRRAGAAQPVRGAVGGKPPVRDPLDHVVERRHVRRGLPASPDADAHRQDAAGRAVRQGARACSSPMPCSAARSARCSDRTRSHRTSSGGDSARSSTTTTAAASRTRWGASSSIEAAIATAGCGRCARRACRCASSTGPPIPTQAATWRHGTPRSFRGPMSSFSRTGSAIGRRSRPRTLCSSHFLEFIDGRASRSPER